MRLSFKGSFGRDLLDILAFLASQKGVRFYTEQGEEEFSFYADLEAQEAVEFAEFVSQNLPHSLFLQDFEVSAQTGEAQRFSSQVVKTEFEFLTPFNLTQNADKEAAKAAADAILRGEEVEFEGVRLRAFDGDFGEYLLSTQPQKLGRMVLVSDEEARLLMAYEKPVLRLKTAALWRSNHPNSPLFVNVRLAWNSRVLTLCDELSQKVAFLSVTTPALFVVNAFKGGFCVVKNESFLPQMQRRAAVFAEFELNLSKPDSLRVVREGKSFELVKVRLPQSVEEVLECVKGYESGERLVENFSKNFSLANLEERLKHSAQPESFARLFELAFALVFAPKSASEIFELADDSVLNKGFALDFIRGEDGVFEWGRLFRGAMSYALAGADERLFVLSFVQGLARFLGELREMSQEDLGVGEFYLSGEAFAYKKMAQFSQQFCHAKFATLI